MIVMPAETPAPVNADMGADAGVAGPMSIRLHNNLTNSILKKY